MLERIIKKIDSVLPNQIYVSYLFSESYLFFMSKKLIDNILVDMNKQGFPLEVQTSEALQSFGWDVNNQVFYQDSESIKNRTLDIVAEKNIILRSNLGFDVWLFIECKKVNKPWVFYTKNIDATNEEIVRTFSSSTQFFINNLAYQNHKNEEVMNYIQNFIFKNKLQNLFSNKIAFNTFEPFTEGNGMSIHKARMQLSNSILDLSRKMDGEILPNISFPYGILFLPIIVLDGQLLIYEKDQLNFGESVNYHLFYSGSSFIIEIITAKKLVSYLENLEKIINNFKKIQVTN